MVTMEEYRVKSDLFKEVQFSLCDDVLQLEHVIKHLFFSIVI